MHVNWLIERLVMNERATFVLAISLILMKTDATISWDVWDDS
jgi:hypothetical protein